MALILSYCFSEIIENTMDHLFQESQRWWAALRVSNPVGRPSCLTFLTQNNLSGWRPATRNCWCGLGSECSSMYFNRSQSAYRDLLSHRCFVMLSSQFCPEHGIIGVFSRICCFFQSHILEAWGGEKCKEEAKLHTEISLSRCRSGAGYGGKWRVPDQHNPKWPQTTKGHSKEKTQGFHRFWPWWSSELVALSVQSSVQHRATARSGTPFSS